MGVRWAYSWEGRLWHSQKVKRSYIGPPELEVQKEDSLAGVTADASILTPGI